MKKSSSGMIIPYLILLMGALLIGGASVAWFTSSAENTRNTFQSGTLNIMLDREQGNYYFDIQKIAPGDQGSQLIVVSNTGSLDLDYQITYMIKGILAEGAYPLEIQFLNSSERRIDLALERRLLSGQQEPLMIIWEMPQEAGNEYQAGTARFDVQVTASQVADDSQTEGGLITTFHQNSTKIIQQMVQHYQEFGFYGRSWGDFAFTDIDLSPDDWSSPAGNLYYKPAGSRLGVKPAEGYQMKVQGINESVFVLTHAHNWSLWFDLISQKWYFKSTQPGNEVEIATLAIVVDN
jgi:predicted ribosomally synthesized peptide with SipW-like signal peptide